jgi:hypothetical protein
VASLDLPSHRQFFGIFGIRPKANSASSSDLPRGIGDFGLDHTLTELMGCCGDAPNQFPNNGSSLLDSLKASRTGYLMGPTHGVVICSGDENHRQVELKTRVRQRLTETLIFPGPVP